MVIAPSRRSFAAWIALVLLMTTASAVSAQTPEPPPADSVLWRTPNLYLTPHASAISAEYLDLYFEELAGELAGLDLGAL